MLLNLNELKGLKIRATDGEIGSVDQFTSMRRGRSATLWSTRDSGLNPLLLCHSSFR
jgi:hypothetical protein